MSAFNALPLTVRKQPLGAFKKKVKRHLGDFLERMSVCGLYIFFCVLDRVTIPSFLLFISHDSNSRIAMLCAWVFKCPINNKQ